MSLEHISADSHDMLALTSDVENNVTLMRALKESIAVMMKSAEVSEKKLADSETTRTVDRLVTKLQLARTASRSNK